MTKALQKRLHSILSLASCLTCITRPKQQSIKLKEKGGEKKRKLNTTSRKLVRISEHRLGEELKKKDEIKRTVTTLRANRDSRDRERGR